MVKLLKAAIYTRVSTREQAKEGYSIDEQERLLRGYCATDSMEVFNVYSDKGISGKNIVDRPGIQMLMADAEKGKFDVVVVWRANRLARKLYDTLAITDKLNAFNIELRSYTESWDILTAQGRLQMNIIGSFAEYEREQIAENVKMGMEARAEEGRWNGGTVLGYDLIEIKDSTKKRSNKVLIINEREAEIIKKIFEIYYKGNGYKVITKKLNELGYRSKKGNHFSICTVREILRNPLYSGKIRYNLKINRNSKKRKGINPDPIIVDGIHEAIIPEEMFNRVQELMVAKGGKPRRTFDGSFPLTGLLRCPVCHAGMVAGRVTRTNKDGTKKSVRYYNCGAWRNKGTEVCHANGVRADDVEKYVFSKIKRLILSEPFLKMALSRANEKRREILQPAGDRAKNIETRIQELEDNRDNYLKLMESKVMKPEDIIPRLKEITDSISRLETEKMRQEGYQNQNSFEDIPFELVKATLEGFEEMMKHSSGNEERKTLLHLMIHEITISKDRKVEDIVIKFNNALVEYARDNGGLPDEGDPFNMYKNRLEFNYYDFRIAI